MIRTALSSTAFIGSTIPQVLETAVASKAQGIEWTDDGFIQPGDSVTAQSAMMATLRAGLSTVSYAVTFRVGSHDPSAFRAALDTARGLNAPILRLWSSPKSQSSKKKSAFISIARTLGDEVGEQGVTLCFGLASDSLLDTTANAAKLLEAIDHPFVKMAWEPSAGLRFDNNMEEFSSIAGRIGMIVVRSRDLFGMQDGQDEFSERWLQYLDAFDEQGGSPDMARHVVMRSVAEGDYCRLAADMAAIRSWSDTLRRYHKRRVI
jgi:sugar phosphate isomerase/epimerase